MEKSKILTYKGAEVQLLLWAPESVSQCDFQRLKDCIDDAVDIWQAQGDKSRAALPFVRIKESSQDLH